MFLRLLRDRGYSSCSREAAETKLRTGGILPKGYNVTLYSTWEAQ
jgi:hypothetical protein